MSIKNKNKFKFFNLLLPITILAYFLSMLKAWWPGQMSRDSLDQYLMSLNILPISDWHPPVMALLWRFLNHIIGISSPSTLFVFHLLLYLLGLYLCIIYLTKNNFVRVLIFIIFCAFISSQQIVIWKDTGMVGALLIAIGSSLMLTKTKINWKKNTLLFFGIFSLVYATSIRWNVLPSIVLVSFLLIYSYFGQKLKPKIFPLSFVLLGFLFISSNLLNYSLVKVEKTYPLQHIFIYDIVGVSVRSTGETKKQILQLIPDYWQENKKNVDWNKTETFTNLYNPGNVGSLIFEDNIPLVKEKKDLSELSKVWQKVIFLDFSSYLNHRKQVFSVFMNFSSKNAYYPYNDWINGNDLGISSNSNRLTYISRSWYKNMPNIFYYPWFWLAISLTEITIATFLLIRKKIKIKNIVSFFLVCISGISYVVLLFFIVPAPDFRYAYYLVVSTILSLFLLIKETYNFKTKKR